MKKIMLLTNNQQLITKVKESRNIVLAYDDFMKVFEQLNFHNPDMIIFDFNLVNHDQQFMLESLPKKDEEQYVKLVSIGKSAVKEQLADFALKFDDINSFNSAHLS
tara:strand:- start:2175 stop:2492 length:318 start_codon:yes stop_codon:yes gene_type:complete